MIRKHFHDIKIVGVLTALLALASCAGDEFDSTKNADGPKFGLTWDVGHSKATHEKDVSFLMEHRERLIHFHIHDGTEAPPRDHLALGDGEIDLRACLKLAKERKARCVLETKTIAALKKSVQWLRENWEA